MVVQSRLRLASLLNDVDHRRLPTSPNQSSYLSLEILNRITNAVWRVNRYTLVTGETPEEEEMVNFYKQVIAASSRGIISLFVLNAMISRVSGKGPQRYGHLPDDRDEDV